MYFPEVINYLLSLRYPGTPGGRHDWVCYRNVIQTIIPVVPANTTVSFTIRPLFGVHAWLAWATRIGTDVVPNSFNASILQHGNFPVNGLITQRGRDDPAEYFVLITEEEPAELRITNLSPIAQRWEAAGDYIVIPSPQDLETVNDALRRLNTSKISEELLQQAVHLLGILSGQP